MNNKDLDYLKLLSKQYPTIQSAVTEIINLKAIVSLPKGTEHFLSDLHGEYEAFSHLINSASGVIRKRIEELFSKTMEKAEMDSLATLIYYPEEKSLWMTKIVPDTDAWYRVTLQRLIQVSRSVSSKYTRSKVRKTLPEDFAYVIEELLHEDEEEKNKLHYYDGIIDTIISTDRARQFIIELSLLIRRLAIDRLHIVGDIFDRGPHPDLIVDTLMKYKDVDIQWGNHDIVWMGAAMGSLPLIATLLRIAARYDNLSTVEDAYGINLLPLATFSMQVYKDDPCDLFKPKITGEHKFYGEETHLVAQMHKALSIIQFKLEGQLIQRRPEFGMENRLLLEKINHRNGTIQIEGLEYPLKDTFFPTVDPANPYVLTSQEHEVMDRLRNSFMKSQKMQVHLKYLIDKGSMYLQCNDNLLYHGCIPLNDEGEFKSVKIDGNLYSGKALLDKYDEIMRRCYLEHDDPEQEIVGLDHVYYLWPGPDSPLFGKKKMTTFERYFIADKTTHQEEKNPYFMMRDMRELSEKILEEFDMLKDHSRIINGHVPVKFKKGEDPVKGKGRMIVIDGGLSKAYQSETGIAGYTLIYNSYGLLLAKHEPFESRQKAINEDKDIISELRILQKKAERIRVGDTDTGRKLSNEIEALEKLLIAYREGLIKEQSRD